MVSWVALFYFVRRPQLLFAPPCLFGSPLSVVAHVFGRVGINHPCRTPALIVPTALTQEASDLPAGERTLGYAGHRPSPSAGFDVWPLSGPFCVGGFRTRATLPCDPSRHGVM